MFALTLPNPTCTSVQALLEGIAVNIDAIVHDLYADAGFLVKSTYHGCTIRISYCTILIHCSIQSFYRLVHNVIFYFDHNMTLFAVSRT